MPVHSGDTGLQDTNKNGLLISPHISHTAILSFHLQVFTVLLSPWTSCNSTVCTSVAYNFPYWSIMGGKSQDYPPELTALSFLIFFISTMGYFILFLQPRDILRKRGRLIITGDKGWYPYPVSPCFKMCMGGRVKLMTVLSLTKVTYSIFLYLPPKSKIKCGVFCALWTW